MLINDVSGNLSKFEIESKKKISIILAIIQSSPLNGTASPSSPHILNDTIQRPSVDSLLDELSNARSNSPVYAVPHEVVTPDGKAPKPGRHVTITVRETTTERVAGAPSPHLQSKILKYSLQSLQQLFK